MTNVTLQLQGSIEEDKQAACDLCLLIAVCVFDPRQCCQSCQDTCRVSINTEHHSSSGRSWPTRRKAPFKKDHLKSTENTGSMLYALARAASFGKRVSTAHQTARMSSGTFDLH